MIVIEVRGAVRKWITLGSEGHGFTLCDIRNIGKRQCLPFILTDQPSLAAVWRVHCVGQCGSRKGIWGAMALVQAREEGVHNSQMLDIY